MADLAVNKVLAAADRKKPRDFVDLVLTHRHIMPLWVAIWAAPGRDSGWTPKSITSWIRRRMDFRQQEVDRELLLTTKLSALDAGKRIRAALEEADNLFDRLERASAGCLFVASTGEPIRSFAQIGAAGTKPIEAQRGGAWPSTPDTDGIIPDRLIAEYGYNGEKRNDGRDGDPCPS